MPLRDHFHPPISEDCPWESMHSTWAPAIAGQLNQLVLPPNYRALPRAHAFGRVEIDVATLRLQEGETQAPGNGIATAVWAPPRPTVAAVVDFADRDTFEVQVVESSGRRLVAAIELVSPANKDRPSSRRDFVVKCASYLQQQVALVIVDVVTERRENLHHDLMEFLDMPHELVEAGASLLYAVSYRVCGRDDQRHQLELWPEALALAGTLPTLPLWIAEEQAVPLDLEASYQDACRTLRLS